MATEMNVYITLDYELFLGKRTGTPENCLIRPMNELCKVADKHNFKFVIFVDATYLLRMQQLKGLYKEVDRQYDLVSNHVKSLAERGHDIELHFHPQWLYSDWDEKTQQWRLDRDRYKLSDMPLADAKKYLNEAKELLDSIVGYKTIAYRAGGFCLDEFKEFKEIFRELGLKIDSSVARYSYVSSPIHSYDYRHIPQKQIYNFEDSIKTECQQGRFIEYSISAVFWSPMYYFTRVRPQRVIYQPTIVYKDGTGISDGKKSKIRAKINAFLKRSYLCSIDGEWSNLLDMFYDKLKNEGYGEIVLIGHPKNASDVSINNLEHFLSTHADCSVQIFTT